MGEEVKGLRSTNRELQNSHGDVKYSIGKGVAKELICMTPGREQWWEDCLRRWGVLGRGRKGGTIRTTAIASSIKYNFLKDLVKGTGQNLNIQALGMLPLLTIISDQQGSRINSGQLTYGFLNRQFWIIDLFFVGFFFSYSCSDPPSAIPSVWWIVTGLKKR